MSKVNLEYTHVGKRTVSGSTVTFTNKTLFGRGGIKADIKFNTAEASQWEAGVEHDKITRVTGGSCDYETGVMTDDAFALVLGHTKNATGVITCNGDDVAPEMGMCCIITTYNDGEYKYRGLWFNRVKFKEPDESYETAKGDINLTTYSMSSSIMLDDDHNYREFKTFDTLSEAKTWCDSHFTADASSQESPTSESESGTESSNS